MKNNLKKMKQFLFLITILLLYSCGEEMYESNEHNHTSNNAEITFSQFKNETKVKRFKIVNTIEVSDVNYRELESGYVADTTKILKHIDTLYNKTTYSFKIFPIENNLSPNEYYNLVVEKQGAEVNELIFLNTEKNNPQVGEAKLEKSELIYSSKSSNVIESMCAVTTYTFNCTCIDKSNCDGCSQCIKETITYQPCPTFYTGNENGGNGSGGIVVGNNGDNNYGGGGIDGGIFIPNPYEGEEDPTNFSFVLAGKITMFINPIKNSTAQMQNLFSSTTWLHAALVDFANDNDDFTQADKNAITFALNNISSIYTKIYQNSANMTANEIDVLKYNALKYLLNNPGTTVEQYVNWFSFDVPGVENIQNYDDSYWNNPSLTFPQQSLPSYLTLKGNFPNLTINAQQLCTQIGGDILLLHNTIINSGKNINTCAIRLSKALNDSGIIIPYIPGKTKAGVFNGSNTKYYFTFAADLNKWMIKTFGTNSNIGLGPTNNNHKRIYYSHISQYIDPANGNILSPDNPLNNLQGIFSMVSSNLDWSTGHCDILQSNTTCVNNCHFEGPIKYIDIWVLN